MNRPLLPMYLLMKKLSLRSKIIIALTIIPMVSLGAFLLMTFLSFKSDRLAYIYESSLSQSRLLNKYATENLNTIYTILDQWVMLYKIENQVSENFVRQYLQKSHLSTSIKEVVLLEYDLKNLKVEKKVDLLQNQNATLLANWIQELPAFIKRIQGQGKNIFLAIPDSNNWVMISLFPLSEDKKIVTFLTFDNPWTRSKFPGQIVIDSFWVNDEGKILSQDTQLDVETQQSLLTQVLRTKSSSGTFLFTGRKQSYIASFSYSNQFAILPINIIKTNAAYEAVYIILEKSLMVLVILICLSILFGILVAKRLTVSLEELINATIAIGKGKFNLKFNIRSGDEFEVLANGFKKMSTEIKTLVDANKEAGRMESELQLARTVQTELLPQPDYQQNEITLNGYTQAASECSGDWWNYFETEKYFYLFVGDATGHGASAALFTSAINSIALLLKNMQIESPKDILNHMNLALHQTAKGAKSITLSLLRIEKNTGHVVYGNASHEFPYLIRNLNETTRYNNIECLNSDESQPLGFLPDSKYQEYEFQLADNDYLVFYTDGITEALNPEEKMWGERKFVNSIIDSLRSGYDLKDSLEKFLIKFRGHIGKRPLQDDATVVIFNYKKAS